ncbi:MAG: alpha-amylase/4-alpha-glucanotransferase domain-containing protein, partial [Candidatus Omnitrophota bacterium]
GSCRLAASSYEEMMSWSDGNFRNFFLKYPEANNLFRRMLYVSAKLKLQTPENQEARNELYMGQCNCTYWHGVFGGVYLTFLRHAAYKHLLAAQALVERQGEFWVEAESLDFDGDGVEEIILKNPNFNLFIAPQRGGGIFEIDYIPKRVNLTDVMTRRAESYHSKVGSAKKAPLDLTKDLRLNIHDLLGCKERGLEHLLFYDNYRRMSLLEHFWPRATLLQEVKTAAYIELGDFINEPYRPEIKRYSEGIAVILTREGKVRLHERAFPVRITKQININDKDARVNFGYRLENLGSEPIEALFAVEFNLAPESQATANQLHLYDEFSDKLYALNEDIEVKAVRNVLLHDAENGIETSLHFEKQPKVWIYPLETISASEAGFERNYQHSVILAVWDLRLESSWQANVVFLASSKQTPIKT